MNFFLITLFIYSLCFDFCHTSSNGASSTYSDYCYSLSDMCSSRKMSQKERKKILKRNLNPQNTTVEQPFLSLSSPPPPFNTIVPEPARNNTLIQSILEEEEEVEEIILVKKTKHIIKKKITKKEEFSEDESSKNKPESPKSKLIKMKKEAIERYRKSFPSLGRDDNNSRSPSPISDIEAAYSLSLEIPDCPYKDEVDSSILAKLVTESSLKCDDEIKKYCLNLPKEWSKAPLLEGDRRESQKKLKITTFNCRFLFSTPPTAAKSVNFPWRSETDIFDHIKYVSAVIEKLNSDIIVLNEVQDYNTMEWMRLSLSFKARKQYRSYLLQGRDYTTEMNVGLLTKVDPVEDLDDFQHEMIEHQEKDGSVTPIKIAKGLIAKFHIGKEKIAILGVHLIRSDPKNPSLNTFREGQAKIIVDVALKLKNNGWKIIIMGDMNDNDIDALSSKDQLFLDSDPTKSVRSQALFLLKNSKGLTLKNSLENFTHQYVRASTVYNSLIDHILYDCRLKFLSNEILQPPMNQSNFHYTTTPHSSDHFPISMTLLMA